MPKHTRLIAIVAISLSACTAPTTFGVPCTSAASCASGERCLSGVERCTPERLVGEAGETCAEAMALVEHTTIGAGGRKLSHWAGSSFIGTARGPAADAPRSSCGDADKPDVFFSFTTAEPITITAHVVAPAARATLSLREGDGCGEVPLGCGGPAATGSETLVYPMPKAGTWIVAVHIDDPDAGTPSERGFTLTVDEAECPPGFLPDADACLGFVELRGLDVARTDHNLLALPGGRAIVVGGRDAQNRTLSEALIFDGVNLAWRAVGMVSARAAASAAALPDGTVYVYGGVDATQDVGLGEMLRPSRRAFEPIPVSGVDVPDDFVRNGSLVATDFTRGLSYFGDGNSVALADFSDTVSTDAPCTSALDCSETPADYACLDGADGAVCVCIAATCSRSDVPRWFGTFGAPFENRRHATGVSLDASSGSTGLLVGGEGATDAAILAAYERSWRSIDTNAPAIGRLDPGVVVEQDVAIVVGGMDGLTPSDAVESFSLRHLAVEARTRLSTPRGKLALVSTSRGPLAIGGFDGSRDTATTEWVPDLAHPTGRIGPALPWGLARHAAVALEGGDVLVIGGERDAPADDGHDPVVAPVALLLTHVKPGASGAIDVDVNAVELPRGDACADADPIPAGRAGVVSGSTRGSRDDVAAYACRGDSMDGPDTFFSVELAAQATFHGLILTSLDVELGLQVLDGCGGDVGSHCVASSGELSSGFAEVSFTAPAAGNYIVSVDGYLFDDYAFVMNWCIAEPGDTCTP